MSGTSHLRKWAAPLLLALLLAAGYVIYTQALLLPQGATALSWTPPMETEANEPLTNLAGYNIHCWGDSGRYTNTIRIEDPSTTRYVVDGLKPGRYQCAVSAFTEDGFESALSNVVERSVE
jgi:hypothetical protein